MTSLALKHLFLGISIFWCGYSFSMLQKQTAKASHACTLAKKIILAAVQRQRTIKQKTITEFPLHEAILINNYPRLEELLCSGRYDINALDKTGRAPLHYAVEQESHMSTKILLQHKADTNRSGVLGYTALHHAVEKNNHKAVQLLLKENPRLIDMQDALGRTAAHIAFYASNAQTITTILSFKPDLTLADSNKNTPLHCIMLRKNTTLYTAHPQFFTELITHLAQADINWNILNGEGNSPLSLYLIEVAKNIPSTKNPLVLAYPTIIALLGPKTSAKTQNSAGFTWQKYVEVYIKPTLQ